MSTDPKITANLPTNARKPEDDTASTSLPPNEADAVKGGALPKPPGLRTNHNQTLRSRRASRL